MVSETEVTVRGRLGHNPELQQTPGKKQWLRLRVATNRRIRSGETWIDGPTSWYDVKIWDDFAQNVAMSLRKGDAVIVQGALQIEEYTNTGGVTLKTPVIHANALGPDLRYLTAHVLRINRAQAVEAPVDISGMQEVDGDAGDRVDEPGRADSPDGADGGGRDAAEQEEFMPA